VTPGEIAAAVTGSLPPGVRCEADQDHGVTLDVAPEHWVAALTFARDGLDCDFFDWLTAVDEQEQGFCVVVHLYSLTGRHHLLVRTLVPRAKPSLPTASGLYRGAAWHERETHEMFGVVFEGHPGLAPLLLPGGFEGHPLRKDFALAARAAKDWPGAKEPGERDVPRARRRVAPPGVPEGWQPP
jgi:NADH-quinone oxidoreductase subunit C